MRRTVENPEFELPLRSVTCPFCAHDVTVEELSLLETLWMHEYECPGIAALEPAAAAA